MDSLLVNTSDSMDDINDNDLVANLDRYLWMLLSPVILLLGLTGNILIIFVVRRRKLSGSTTGVYLPSMAIMDSATLITGIIPEWLEAMQLVVFKEISGATCKIEKFLFYTSADTATWILVLFTFDRFVAVCFPLKKRNFCTPRRAKVAVGVTAILAVAKNLHVFWTRGPVYDMQGNLTSNCGRPEPHTEFELFIRPWIAFSLANSLPFIVILFCNIMIIKTITKVQKMRRDQTNAEKSMMQTVAMCLSASFTFLICVTPSMVLLIGRPYWTSGDEPNYAYNIAKAINNQLVMVNHSINVVLYCLSGQKFREELVEMLRCSSEDHSPLNSRLSLDNKNIKETDVKASRGSNLDNKTHPTMNKSPRHMSATVTTSFGSASKNDTLAIGNNNHNMIDSHNGQRDTADVEISIKDTHSKASTLHDMTINDTSVNGNMQISRDQGSNEGINPSTITGNQCKYNQENVNGQREGYKNDQSEFTTM